MEWNDVGEKFALGTGKSYDLTKVKADGRKGNMEQRLELLRVNNICKTFLVGDVKIEALRGVSLNVYEGELIVILGPSGSGKSTLLNILGGIDRVSSGEVLYRDVNLSAFSDADLSRFRREHISFVFQFYNLMPHLSALENVELAAELSKNPLNAKELLKQVDLADRMDNFPSKLSGGQQQRVAIARALCKNPDLLLCDEPTGALDISTGIGILRLLSNFNKRFNKTVMIITHNENIAYMADRVFYIKDGKLDRIVVNEHPVSPEEVKW